MTRSKLHTIQVKFTIRLENRLNQTLKEWAKEERVSKSFLIEQILGLEIRRREKGNQVTLIEKAT